MKMTLPKVLRTAFVVLIAAAILFGAVFMPQAQASSYRASYIDRVDGKVSVDFEEYLAPFCLSCRTMSAMRKRSL